MRASMAAESAGIPSVSIVCDGFAGQANATAKGLGYDGLALAVTSGHVDTQSADEMIAHFTDTTIDRIVDGLVGESSAGAADADEPEALGDEVRVDVVDVARGSQIEGWTDGLPIVPPTVDRVERFLDGSGQDPWKSLGTAPSSGRELTIWSIAVNAVMAGCQPEHLSVLLALGKILADPNYGSEHSGNTTGADALIVLSGPLGEQLGFNHGPGAQREGALANTSVGRWLRLYLRNVCGFTTTEHDKATFGNPTKPVLAEDHGCLCEIGWPSVATQLGVPGGANAVSMARMNSGILIGSVFGSTPEEIVPYLADGVARTASWDLTHIHGLGTEQFSPLLVLSPMLARTIAAAGWTLPDLQRALFEQARITARSFERYIGDWSNLSAGRPKLIDLVADGLLPDAFGESPDPERLVPVASRPERFMVAVSGDPSRANAFAYANDGPHGWWTTKPFAL